MNTPEQSIGDLAIALGMLMAHEGRPTERMPAYECFIESVLVLAFNAGVERKDALRPFDVYQKFAFDTWNQIVEDVAGSSIEKT